MDNNNTEELKIWYYIDQGEITGPFKEDEMLEFYQQNKLEDNTEVWKSGMPDWVEITSSDLLKKEAEVPRIKVIEINNTIPWIIAFIPVLFAGAISMRSLPLCLILIMINCIISVLDAWFLVKAGLANKLIMIWALLLPPIYLFKRSRQLNTGNSYAYMWCSFFVAELLIFTKIFGMMPLIHPQKTPVAVETQETAEDGSITVDDFVKAYIKDPQYEVKKQEDGTSLFNVIGKMDYEGKEADVTLSLRLEADSSVHFKEMMINKTVESTETYHNLMAELKGKID